MFTHIPYIKCWLSLGLYLLALYGDHGNTVHNPAVTRVHVQLISHWLWVWCTNAAATECMLTLTPEITLKAIVTIINILYPEIPHSVTKAGNHSSEGKRWQGKKDQRLRSDSGPTLYRGVSVTRATETGRDPSSLIALKYRSQVCRYPVTLKTCALRLVLCAMWW